MFKLAPLLSYAYVFTFASKAVIDMHKKLLEDIKKDKFNKLEVLHHLTSGFKACFTQISYDGLDALR